MKKTYIKGKTLALEESIENMQNLLKRFKIEIVEKGIKKPVENIYSVFIYAKNSKELYSNGKGSTLLAAKASALGEFCERLLNKFFFNDFYIKEATEDKKFVFFRDEKSFKFKDNILPEGLLNDELLSFYNPNGELEPLNLMDFNSFDLKKGIIALPFIEEFSKKRVYFPINLLNNLYVSNGLSAGNSANEAKVQAICEIYERYVKNEIFKNAYTLPRVNKESIKSSKIKEALGELGSKGFNTIILDASLGGVFPVLCVVFIDRKNSKALASFGSHPNFEIALERTITEMLQGRELKRLNDFTTPTLNKDAVADISNLEEHFINSTGLIAYELFAKDSSFDLHNWNFEGSVDKELEYLLNIAKEQNLKVYTYEAYSGDIFAYRVLIPTLSEIYEVDDLIYNNSNLGAFFRDAILNLNNLNKYELKELLEHLEDYEVDNSIELAKFIGVVFKKKYTIAELKLYILLYLQEYEEAKKAIEEINFYKNKRLYKLIETLLEIILNDLDFLNYKRALVEIYGEKKLEKGVDIIEAKKCLFNLKTNKLSKKYKKIIKIYNALSNL